MNALSFLLGESVDSSGRNVSYYCQMPYKEWEGCHDHIQWAFPNDKMSMYNSNAPIFYTSEYDELTPMQKAICKTSIINLMTNYMLSIGVEYCSDKSVVFRVIHAPTLKDSVSQGNHNNLRLTRLFRCLHLFGINLHPTSAAASKFIKMCLVNGIKPSQDAIGYWKNVYVD